MSAPGDPYKVLQVDTEAEDEVIAAAYRRLAMKYHPDTGGPESQARMSAINAAWEVLGDPDRRAAFDRERSVQAAMVRARTQAPEAVSRDWTSGRSSVGGGYDSTMRTADGEGAAGPPPGNPSGSILNFGRYTRWSLGEIARVDLEYIEWLDRIPIGRPYREEIDAILRRTGRRRSSTTEADSRRGLFRRR
ncbi:MAG: DnaJ domain-containing protein [Chloroflexota bacterium]